MCIFKVLELKITSAHTTAQVQAKESIVTQILVTLLEFETTIIYFVKPLDLK